MLTDRRALEVVNHAFRPLAEGRNEGLKMPQTHRKDHNLIVIAMLLYAHLHHWLKVFWNVFDFFFPKKRLDQVCNFFRIQWLTPEHFLILLSEFL
jgi:hypothetical protein